jgi:hypothetical protein
VRYAIALLGYIAIGLLTKSYLSFTWGLLYFVLAVEVVPSFLRRIRGERAEPDRSAPESVVDR